MRILIDLRCLQSPLPRGGVGVFAEESVRALLAHDSTNEYLLFANGLAHPRRHLPAFDAPNARWIITRGPNKLLNPLHAIHRTPYAFPDADVLLLPNLNFLPELPKNTKLIVTVHDLSFAHFPDFYSTKQRLWHRRVSPNQLLARADAIVAVSATTKRDVVETYEIPEER